MGDMPFGTIDLTTREGVATLTLQRPESLNSMTDEMMQDLRTAIEAVDADGEARVLVITGSGRGFCSGADLSAVPPSAGTEVSPAEATAGMEAFFNPAIAALKNCRVPTVAAVNGAAAGGGLGLALACDIVIAARSAFFVATFGPRLGIVPDLGSTWSLPARVGQARAMGMAMLGDRIDAELAAEWGLIWRVVDDDELALETRKVTDVLRSTSPEAMQRIRSAISSSSTRSFEDQLDLEAQHQAVLIPMNMAEGADAFLAKREPKFEA